MIQGLWVTSLKRSQLTFFALGYFQFKFLTKGLFLENQAMKPLISPIKNFVAYFLMIASLFGSDDEHLPQGGHGEVVAHSGYILQYDNEREQARWVAYELTKEEVLNRVVKRTDNFKEDPDVDLGSASLDDYKGSGFDRGHLAPAADLAWSSESMSDSFYLSNMSPQDPSFNRGIWKKLEEQVRTWAVNNDSVYVVSGALYLEDLRSHRRITC
jgi:endonuclease G